MSENATSPPSVDGFDELSPSQAVFVTALLATGDVPAACKAAGVNRSTASRWMRSGEVQRIYREARSDAFRRVVATIQNQAGALTAELVRVALASDTPPGVKVQACCEALKVTRQSIELDDLELRMRAIEEAEILPPYSQHQQSPLATAS